MQIAVLIDCFRLAVACADNCFRLIFKIDSDSTVFSFHINECDEMFRKHRMCNTTYLYFDTAVIKTSDDRHMFLVACINCVWDQLLHLLTAADYRYF